MENVSLFTELLAEGEAIPGEKGACAWCHHAKVWHKPKTKFSPCERCDCSRFVQRRNKIGRGRNA
jgi:hypothetical protein